MADMADNLVTLIDTKWSGPTKPDIIEKVLARPDIAKLQSKDYVIVYPLGSGRHVHVTRDYYNTVYGFEILCFTPTSSDRLQELYEEVIDVLYNWYLTGVDLQRVMDQRDLSDKKTGRFKYTIHIELETIMAYKGAAVQSGIPAGDASVYAPKDAQYVVKALHDDLTAEELHSTLSGAELHSPKAHASSHQSGGGDAVKLDDLGAPDDNTDLNVSITKHGLCPKLSNVVTEFLNGQGGWTVPAGGGGGAPTGAKYVVTELHAELTAEELHNALTGAALHDPKAHAASHLSGGSDAIKLDDLAAPDDNTDLDASLTKHGLLKKLGGGTTNFLRADGAWAAPPGGGGTSYITIPLFHAENPDVVSGSSYVSRMEFKNNRWKDLPHSPTKGRLVAHIAILGSGSMFVRLYDTTTSSELIELSTSVTGNSSSTDTVISDEFNLPTNTDNVQLQVKETAINGYMLGVYLITY